MTTPKSWLPKSVTHFSSISSIDSLFLPIIVLEYEGGLEHEYNLKQMKLTVPANNKNSLYNEPLWVESHEDKSSLHLLQAPSLEKELIKYPFITYWPTYIESLKLKKKTSK